MKKFLGAIFAFFVAVLIVCWYIAKQANPVLLDERGEPISSSARR